MRDFIKIADLKKYGVEMQEHDINSLEEKRKELAVFLPFGELIEVANLSHYDGKYHFEYCEILFKYKGHLLTPHKGWKETGYRFFYTHAYSHKHTHNYKNRNEQPNRVGKPTEKKLNDWLQYLLNEEDEKRAYALGFIQEEQNYRAELAKLGDSVKWLSENHGYILKNNIKFEFTLQQNYISTKVSLYNEYQIGLTQFLQLADNKYQKVKK